VEKRGTPMKKVVLAFAAAALLAVPATASAGNAWGKKAGDCAADLELNLGQAIQAGKAAHPGVKMTPQAIAESVHCAS
jgi:hypothetical protein